MIRQRLPATALDRMMILARTLHDGQMRYYVTVTYRVDAELLARALRLMMDAEPVLGCRFVPRPWNPYWERRDDLDRVPLVRIFEPPNLEEKMWKFLEAPLDPEKDLLVQVGLFRGSRDTYAIRLSHDVMDGAGLAEFGIRLRLLYSELEANPAYRPPSSLHLSRGQGQVFRAAGLKTLLRGCMHLSLPRQGASFPCRAGTAERERRLSIRRVEPQDFRRIKEYCQRQGFSFNSVMLAAYYRALFKILGEPPDVPLAVQVTSNLRRYLPLKQRPICSLTGIYFPALRYKDFEKMAAELSRITETANAQGPWLGQAFVLEMAFRLPYWLVKAVVRRSMARQLASGRVFPFFANLGMYPLPDSLASKMVDMGFFGPVPHPPGCFLLTYAVGGQLVVSGSFCHSPSGTEKSDRLLDLFVAELPTA